MSSQVPDPVEIEQEIARFVVSEFYWEEGNAPKADTLLFKSRVIDSLGVVRLIGFLVDHFQISLEPDDVVLENLESISKIRDLVVTCMNRKH